MFDQFLTMWSFIDLWKSVNHRAKDAFSNGHRPPLPVQCTITCFVFRVYDRNKDGYITRRGEIAFFNRMAKFRPWGQNCGRIFAWYIYLGLLFSDLRRASRALTDNQIEASGCLGSDKMKWETRQKLSPTSIPRQFFWCTTLTRMGSWVSWTLKGSWRTTQDENSLRNKQYQVAFTTSCWGKGS